MTFLFNLFLMHFIGEKGGAAITILLYLELFSFSLEIVHDLFI